VTNLSFDQLTTGAKLALTTGEVYPPSSASTYAATAFSSRTPMLILDGSNSSGDWFGASGSMKKLIGALGQQADTVGIIASASTPAAANSIQSTLASWGSVAVVLWMDESLKDDQGLAAAANSCRGFVFAGNNPDSLARFLDSTTNVGRAFRGRVQDHVPLLFLSDDVMMAGEQGIGQMYKHIYGAYYGYMTQVKGLGILKGMQVVPRLYEASDYIDNRASAVFWSMVRSHLPYGVLLDAGTHVVIDNGQMRIHGATPAILVDAREAQWGSLPDFRDPGKANPRQNGGIIGGAMHILRDGAEFIVGGTLDVRGGMSQASSPIGFELLQNYPNPFNPSTKIGFRVSGEKNGSGGWGSGSSWVRLAVYDMLGREVAVLVNERKEPGDYSVTWHATGMASGVYYYRLSSGGFVCSRALVLLR
jgi:hypothetical protein